MPWLQLTLHVSSQQAELTSDALDEAGAISVTLQDDAGEIVIETHWNEQPLWSKVRVTALLPLEANAETAMQHIAQRLELPGIPEYVAEQVDDQDWAHAWKKHYKPIHMGGKLWICPSWCEPPHADAVNVILDPGMAFGTGDHPTTALCLEWLAQQDLRNKLILDYGCGSGILAIAAIKLGARAAYAVDIDEQALTVTRENAQRNGVLEHVRVMQPAQLPAGFQADTLVANILAGALIELAPTLVAHTRAGSGLVLSGLLSEQGPMVSPHYRPAFALETRERQGWVSLSGFRSHA